MNMIEQSLKVIGFVPMLLLNTIDYLTFWVLYLTYGKQILSFDEQDASRRKLVKAKPVNPNQDLGSNSKETCPYRNAKHMDKLLETPVEGVNTLTGLLDWAVDQYGDKQAMGKRIMEKIERKPVKSSRSSSSSSSSSIASSSSPSSSSSSTSTSSSSSNSEGDQKPKERFWEIAHYKRQIQWFTYNEIGQRTKHIATGIAKLTGMTNGDHLITFENTCLEWMLMAHGCFRARITLATVYANLGIDSLISAINETNSKCLFVNIKENEIFGRVSQECPHLKYIIYNFNGVPDGEREGLVSKLNGMTRVKCLSFEDVEHMGSQEKEKNQFQKANSDDLTCIMYTSGTTGKPKGVQLTHKQCLSCIAGVNDVVGEANIEMNFLGYLPLAHILEFVAEHVMMVRGGKIGYGSPRTITGSGAKPYGDLDAFSPNVLIGVPKMFETIRKKALEKLKQSGTFKSYIFNQAFKFKLRAIKSCRATPVWDALIFKDFRKLIGGNVKVMLSGGAPLSVDSQEFIRVCFGATFIQGYGLTESAGAIAIQGLFDPFETRLVGVPIPSCEVKLVSEDEMGYKVSDKPYPRGELLVRGNNITAGYFKQDDKTEEAFSNGWFHTGDIAQIRWDGVIQIVDRKKNLVKLSGGEYVAIEHLESLYSNSPVVSSLMLYADQNQDAPVALVIPNFKMLIQWARENNLPADDKNKLVENKKVIEYVKQLLYKEATKVKSFERIADLRLLNDEWTVENDCLTAAQKLKRRTIEKRHKDLLDTMKLPPSSQSHS